MQIQLINPFNNHLLSLAAEGLLENCALAFPKKNGAYRIVSDDNYTHNFGYQWNKFAGTQVDKTSKLHISKTRFFAETNWEKEDLTGKNILEVGSGAGRFTQILLDHTNANVFSVDYSNAVEANYQNNGHHDRLQLFQASIYEMPFAKAQFDKVLCLGVLQHTPDFEQSVKALIEMVKPGGELVIGEEMPEPEYIRPASLRKWAEQAGFRLVARNGTAFAYLLKFVKPLAVLEEAEQIAQSVS